MAVSQPTLLLPQPEDIQRGVVVPMETRPTLRAGMPADGQAHGQALRDDDTAARTCLAGERGIDRLHSLPGARSLESEDSEKRAPPGIKNALGQVVVSHQVGDPQVFVIDDVVRL